MDSNQIWFTLNALLLGLLVGALLGYQLAKRRNPAADPQLATKLAALQATETELRNQLAKSDEAAKAQKLEAEKENKVLLELAPVKTQLEQMQTVVQRLEK
ncbi:MAG: DNA recombination protein RmuC, partial [Aquiluna sp.]